MYTVTIRFQFFVSFLCQAKEKPQVEHVERPRGNIPFRLYLSYFKAGVNCLTLFLVLIFGIGAQVNITHLFFFPSQYKKRKLIYSSSIKFKIHSKLFKIYSKLFRMKYLIKKSPLKTINIFSVLNIVR